MLQNIPWAKNGSCALPYVSFGFVVCGKYVEKFIARKPRRSEAMFIALVSGHASEYSSSTIQYTFTHIYRFSLSSHKLVITLVFLNYIFRI